MPSFEFEFHTFGCKVNSYDTGILQEKLTMAEDEPGVKSECTEPAASVKDLRRVHVLNTCAVTQNATLEAVRLARRLKRREPTSHIVVTGCAAQVDADRFIDIPEVDLVIANSHKNQIRELIEAKFKHNDTERLYRSNIFKLDDLGVGGGQRLEHTRSFLKIQDGCNSFCSFCIIPFARGKSRSIPVQQLVDRVNELSQRGYQEVVLTGVHIGDYQDDQEQKLEDLLEALLLKTQIPRLRLSSLEPIELSQCLLELFQEQRLCPHFHMSIQSAQTDVLRRMRRKYSSQDVEVALTAIAQKIPGAFVGMDVIAGFTGETDAEHNETVNRLENLPWSKIHVFPYSERQGTLAARATEQIPIPIRHARAEHLRKLSDHRFSNLANAQIGLVKRVLRLKDSTTHLGLSRDYWHVRVQDSVDSNLNLKGESPEYKVKISGIDQNSRSGQNGILIGTLC